MASRKTRRPRPSRKALERAEREVHRNPPRTLDPSKKGPAREAQLQAIAHSKARRSDAKKKSRKKR